MGKWPIFAVSVFVSFIILAHFQAPASYSWMKNTISELASQGYEHKWLMQLGLISFGLLFIFSMTAFLAQGEGLWYRELPFMIYGGAIALSGIFCAGPFTEGVDFSIKEAQLHSLFAQIAGVAFSIGILVHGITSPKVSGKAFHFAYLLFVVLFSLLFGLVPRYAGVMQRILYLGSFSWIVLTYGLRLDLAFPK